MVDRIFNIGDRRIQASRKINSTAPNTSGNAYSSARHLVEFLPQMAESYPSTAAIAACMLADQFDSRTVECIDDFHQTVDDTPDIAFTGLHSLYGR